MELSDATEKNPGIDPGTFRLVAQCLTTTLPQASDKVSVTWINYLRNANSNYVGLTN
jgi:hypothetical protein